MQLHYPFSFFFSQFFPKLMWKCKYFCYDFCSTIVFLRSKFCSNKELRIYSKSIQLNGRISNVLSGLEALMCAVLYYLFLINISLKCKCRVPLYSLWYANFVVHSLVDRIQRDECELLNCRSFWHLCISDFFRLKFLYYFDTKLAVGLNFFNCFWNCWQFSSCKVSIFLSDICMWKLGSS